MRKAVILEAIWGHDYNLRNDQIYKLPCCPKCVEPLFKDEDGKYRCLNCRKLVSVDSKMSQWLREREGTKVEHEDCKKRTLRDGKTVIGCGGKNCMEVTYVKDPTTLEWITAFGVCQQCGARFIV